MEKKRTKAFAANGTLTEHIITSANSYEYRSGAGSAARSKRRKKWTTRLLYFPKVMRSCSDEIEIKPTKGREREREKEKREQVRVRVRVRRS